MKRVIQTIGGLFNTRKKRTIAIIIAAILAIVALAFLLNNNDGRDSSPEPTPGPTEIIPGPTDPDTDRTGPDQGVITPPTPTPEPDEEVTEPPTTIPGPDTTTPSPGPSITPPATTTPGPGSTTTPTPGPTVPPIVEPIKSSNANLSSLAVGSYQLLPVFDPNVTEYSVAVANIDIIMTISYETEHHGATVEVSYNRQSETGQNIATLVVTAEDGETQKTYMVTIYRQASSNANLRSLSVGSYELAPVFAPNVTRYSVSVGNTITGATVHYATEHAGATVQVTGNRDWSVGVNTVRVVVTAEDGVTQKTYTVSVTRTEAPKSSNANLSSLRIGSYTLSPVFRQNTTSYSINVPSNVTSATVNYTTAHAGATVQVSGDRNWSVGVNTVRVVVTAEDGVTQKTYTISVTRASASKSSNANLSSLSIGSYSLSPAFSPNTIFYSISVPNNVTSAAVNYTTSHSGATAQVSGNSGWLVGVNTVQVVVTAEDGVTTKTYTISVTREGTEPIKSSNAYLSSLSIGSYTLNPDFNRNVTSYSINVPNNVTSAAVSYTTEHSGATAYVSGDSGWSVGVNTVTVIVIAENGYTQKTYTILVTRADVPKSSNANLSSLSIGTYSLNPDFDRNVTSYAITVPNNVTSAAVNYTTEHSGATAYVSGNSGWSVGVNTVQVVVTAENGYTQKTYTIFVTREQPSKSSNANLSSLSVVGYSLTPTFSPNVTSYAITVPNNVTSAGINYATEHAGATVQVSGNTGWVVGVNTVRVVVTAEDGVTTKTYTISATREQPPKSTNANLSSLSVDGYSLTPVFSPNVTSYAITVPNNITSATVNYTTEHAVATAQVNGNTGWVVGVNTVQVVVTAEDGVTIKTYTISVTREQPAKSSNANLSSLSVDGYSLTPVFSPNVTSYAITVPNDVTSATVNYTTEHVGATAQVNGNTGWVVGVNTVQVVVTAEDGVTTKTYTISVTREQPAKSSNANLSSLSVDGYSLTPVFSPNVTSYAITVPNNVTSASVNYTTEHVGATVQVNGDSGWLLGANTVTVVVTAEDGVTQKTYTITVTRTQPGNANLSSLSVGGYTMTPGFSPDVTSYGIIVPTSKTSANVSYTTEDVGATAQVSGDSGWVIGNNTLTVVVTAADGITQKTYAVNVYRHPDFPDPEPSNANLSSLSVGGYTMTPGFSPDVTSYGIIVPTSVTSANVSYTTEDAGATAQVSGDSGWFIGNNTVTVVVTSEDSTATKTYTVTVYRHPDFPDPDPSNAKLSFLSVGGYTMTPEFSPDVTSYSIIVPTSVTSGDVSYTTEDAGATVQVSGSTDWVVGANTVTVVVTSEDSTATKTYTVTVTRHADFPDPDDDDGTDDDDFPDPDDDDVTDDDDFPDPDDDDDDDTDDFPDPDDDVTDDDDFPNPDGDDVTDDFPDTGADDVTDGFPNPDGNDVTDGFPNPNDTDVTGFSNLDATEPPKEYFNDISDTSEQSAEVREVNESDNSGSGTGSDEA